ncbi:hypothetical protein ACIQCJ_08885 [Streptomyces sp. NPDC093221]|uniref:hypothetical protein n=1 Tax=Streptomyces sp. NPDC093221 TaxID=3366032 RepID=UPI00382186EF
MHRHEALIAGAVDEWEIAAGLEAHGVTDGAARRLRHRDVFGLAEELYARVPRAVRRLEAAPGERERALPRWRTGAAQAVPGAVCALAAGAPGSVRLPLLAFVAVVAWAAVRIGPLRVERGAGAAVWTYGLLGYALYAGHATGRTAGAATLAALTFALLPAAYCAHWLAVRSRAQLAPSHGLSDFADAVRPRLAAALAAYAVALIALLDTATAVAGSAPLAGPAALGLLLFAARLLSVHGFPGHAAAGLGAACAAEALTLAATPLHLGPAPATAQAVICGAAALALTAQAFRVLPRASAHRPPPRHHP